MAQSATALRLCALASSGGLAEVKSATAARKWIASSSKMAIEVEGKPAESVGGRDFSSAGGDWQPAHLVGVIGDTAKIEHVGVYEDDEETRLLIEEVPLSYVRPAQPTPTSGWQLTFGAKIDAQLPDQDGDCDIWRGNCMAVSRNNLDCGGGGSAGTAADGEEGLFRVLRPESGEQFWLPRGKLRPTRSWQVVPVTQNNTAVGEWVDSDTVLGKWAETVRETKENESREARDSSTGAGAASFETRRKRRRHESWMAGREEKQRRLAHLLAGAAGGMHRGGGHRGVPDAIGDYPSCS